MVRDSLEDGAFVAAFVGQLDERLQNVSERLAPTQASLVEVSVHFVDVAIDPQVHKVMDRIDNRHDRRTVRRRVSKTRASPLFPGPQLERAARALVNVAFGVGVTFFRLAVLVSYHPTRAEKNPVTIGEVGLG
jgi:hypothetical protein